MRPADAEAFERCVAGGGVAVFPTDTLYGLGCDPASAAAVRHMYELKGRAPDKPSAVMFFRLEAALAALGDLGPRTANALQRLLPGPVTLILPDRAGRFEAAGGRDTVGIRVPRLERRLLPLGQVCAPVLQTSANMAGGAEPSRIEEVPAGIRSGADLVLDGGALPGTASTVVDLTRYEESGAWAALRPGMVEMGELVRALGAPG